MSDGVPKPIVDELVIPRTTSDDITRRMRMLDERFVRQDGPPDLPETWDDDDTDIDTVVVDVSWERAS